MGLVRIVQCGPQAAFLAHWGWLCCRLQPMHLLWLGFQHFMMTPTFCLICL